MAFPARSLIFARLGCSFTGMKNPAPIQDEMKSLGALRAWMLSNVSPLVPTELESPLGEVLRYLDLLSTEKASSRGLARHFLRAIGVLPKSEKMPPG